MDGRALTQQLGVEAVIYSMYGGSTAGEPLPDALVAAIMDQDPRGLLELADRSNRRRDDGSYGQLNYSFPAVRCLDSQDDSVREASSATAGSRCGAGARAGRRSRSGLPALAGRVGAAAADDRRRRAPRRSW